MSTPAKHTAFTPGPWGIEYVGDRPANCTTDRPTVAFVGDYRVVSAGRGYDLHGDSVEDARLIAAAPTMFEAGSALIREFDNIYDVDDGQGNIPGDLMALVDELRAAIALVTPVLEREG